MPAPDTHDIDTARLAERLRRTVDDHPIDVPDLMPAVRSAATRRRVAIGGTALATVALAGALAVTFLPRGAAPDTQPAAPPASTKQTASTSRAPQKSKPANMALTTAEITTRCQTQLSSYESNRRWEGSGKAAEYRVARPDRTYKVGDVVTFIGGPNSLDRYCVVPAPGQTINPDATLTPTASNTALMVSACSEYQTIIGHKKPGPAPDVPDEATYRTPDLRGATVVTKALAGGVMSLVLSKGGTQYACSLSSPFWDVGTIEVRALDQVDDGVYFSSFMTGEAGKSIVDGDAVYHEASGRLDSRVATIEVTGQVKQTVTVTNGYYAFVATVPGGTELHQITFTAKAADGSVIFVDDSGPEE